MEICILGSGLQGRVVAQDLAENKHKVTILDNNKDNLKKVIKSSRITTKQFDVTRKKELIRLIKDFDIVVGALPAQLGFHSMQCAVEAGVDIADMSYSGEDPFKLDKQAKKNKTRVIPDAGYAPGLSNILVGEAYRELNQEIYHRDTENTEGTEKNRVNNIRILVGGIPQNPKPPFNYNYTWSPDDLVAEYTRPARIVNNYKEITVEALSGVESFKVPKIGKVECFYTDGLRTLINTFKNVKNMEEKTIRYAGHAELVKELLNYGFSPEEDNPFTNPKVLPKDFILDFLKTALSGSDGKDLSILIIDIKSKAKNRRYTCIDYYDQKNKITSMARMTAYSGSIISQCIKDYPGYGVIAPEKLGMNTAICSFIKKELAKRDIIIKTNTF
ncbi:MAG: saccharopine dehydrogenase NADP-binding domain-containing protein [Candidatus Latescibacteria bacterium]|nr:saccharopine dehydrogenase NADP-binding domain-containing protein [Candidatus Latescibacterota bacterium]